jgi:hypothetical protein
MFSSYRLLKEYTIPYYLEYQRICPFAPSPASECVPPGNQGGGSNTRLRVRGRGEPTRTTGEKAYHSVYSVLQTIVSIL